MNVKFATNNRIVILTLPMTFQGHRDMRSPIADLPFVDNPENRARHEAQAKRSEKTDAELLTELQVAVPEELQLQLAHFMREGGEMEVWRFKAALQRFADHPKIQQHFMATVAAFLDDPEKRYIVIAMGANTRNPQIMDSVLTQFLDIKYASERLAELVQTHNEATPDKTALRNSAKRLYRRAQELFAHNAVRVGVTTAYTAEVKRDLDFVKTDLVIFGQISNLVSKAGGTHLETLEGFEADTIPAYALSENDREDIEVLFRQNKNANPAYTNPDDIEAGLAKLRADLGPDSESMFRIYRYNKKIIACVQTKPISEDIVYVGSFNAHPDVRGTVPTMLADEIITNYGSKYNLVATALEDSAEERWYIQHYGFTDTGKTSQTGSLTFKRLERKRQPPH
jgi:hypothetical protein